MNSITIYNYTGITWRSNDARNMSRLCSGELEGAIFHFE